MGLSIEVPNSVFQNSIWKTGIASTRDATFTGGRTGFWLDCWDMATMFQDAAGTTPVTASGQKVGLILDKSGNGNNAVQTDDDLRPTFTISGTKQFLQFTGTEFLDVVDAAGSFGESKRTVVIAGRIDGDAGDSRKTFMEMFKDDPNVSTSAWTNLSFEINSDDKIQTTISYASPSVDPTAYTFGVDDVISMAFDYVDDATDADIILRRGGAEVLSSTANPDDSTIITTGIRIFANRDKDRIAAGRLYGAVFVRDFLDVSDIEAAFAARCGFTLGS